MFAGLGPCFVFLAGRGDSALGRFVQPDSVIPEAAQGTQAWDRYAYANNNPLKYADPTGHMITDMGDGTNILFTSRQLYSDQETGRALSKASTYLQHGATFFSFLGSVAEIGCTLVGGLGGSVALGWADSISPVGDFTGGLAGVAVGAAVGNAIHKGFTNPIETVLSSASTTATLAGDLATGNSNLTIYSSNATITLAESSATSIALTELGNSATVGIEDFAVDLLGSLSSEGAIAGVYGDSQGNILPILPFINFQLGSR